MSMVDRISGGSTRPARGRGRRRIGRGRPARPVTAAVAATAALAILAGCSAGSDPQASPGGPGGTEPVVSLPDVRLASALAPFDGCDDLLGWVKDQALQRVTAYGLDGQELAYTDAASAVPSTMPASAPRAEESAAGDGATGVAIPDHSATNVQEEGVDEPDTVKSDGRRILAVVDGRLQHVDVTGDGPVVTGSLELPDATGAQILVDGDRVLVISQRGGGWREDELVLEDSVGTGGPAGVPAGPQVVLTLVDVSDPAAMAVRTSVRIDGTSLSARMVDGRARIVTTSSPTELPFVYPSGPSGEAVAEETNRRIIEESTIDDWLPHVRTGTAETGGELAVACENVRHPGSFSGFDALTVQTVGLADDSITPGDATAILADGQTVYASASNLYVATPTFTDVVTVQSGADGAEPSGAAGDPGATEPVVTPGSAAPGAAPGTTPGTAPGDDAPPTTVPDPEQDEERWEPPRVTTAIHRFGIDGDGPATYRSSGEVPGSLLDQFSMSEHDDRLRVATTDQWSSSGTTESFVRVLEERDGELVEVGAVGGLGRGEQIRAVRFLGDQGYVVTFRQTDPLYTIDLADPTAPTVAGELEILGYSAYLHPIGDGLLVGVGQDATEQGRLTGTQVALFDVSDPAAPRRLQQHLVGVGSSIAEDDHHAFLWWDPADLAVIPVQNYDEGTYVEGAIGYRVTPDGIVEVGRIVHPASFDGGVDPGPPPTTIVVPCRDGSCLPQPPRPCPLDGVCGPYPGDPGSAITRALVVGDRVYTVSSVGVLASRLDDLTPIAGVDFVR